MAWIVPLSALLVSPSLAFAANGPGGPGAGTLGRALQVGVIVAAVASLVFLWWRDIIRPGSLERGAKRDVSGLPALAWFASAAFLFLAPAFGHSLVVSLPDRIAGSSGSVRHAGITSIVAYSAAALVAAILVYLLVPRARSAGLVPRWSDAPGGVGAFALTLPIVLCVAAAASEAVRQLTGAPPDQIAHATLEQIREQRANPWTIAVIAGAVIGAPLYEEYTYRVFLQSGFVHIFRARWLAVLVTSAAFAVVHRAGPAPVPWHAIVPIFFLGVACGIAYERTARPGVPIAMHALFNAVNIVMALVLL